MQRVWVLALLAACGSSSSGTTALFALTPKIDYYELPFPNDLHRNSDGTLDLTDFPTNSMIVGSRCGSPTRSIRRRCPMLRPRCKPARRSTSSTST
jgi:hypothetical protein